MPDLYTREFTEDELRRLDTAVQFTRQMLDAADYPQSTLDDLTLLSVRLTGTEFSAEGLVA